MSKVTVFFHPIKNYFSSFRSLITAFVLLAFGFDASAITNQGNFRWRNDDGNETGATYRRAENVNDTLSSASNIRLRVEIYESTGFGSASPTVSLYYSTDNTNFTQITNDGSSNHWKLSNSPNFADGEGTTDQLSNTAGSSGGGSMIESSSGFVASVNASNSNEYEICIAPTANALAGTNYYFRIQTLNGYAGTPQLFFSYTGPLATTQPVSNLTSTSVTLNGVVNANGVSTDVNFSLGVSPGEYSSSIGADQSPVSGSGPTSVSVNLSELTPDQWYYYKVVASNDSGTSSGDEMSFLTPDSIRGFAVQFDGANDYITVALNEPETEITHEFWFKSTTGDGGLLSITESEGGHDRHIYLSGGNIYTRVWDHEILSTSGTNYADGQWHFVAHVIGSSVGGQKLYVDGELKASGTKSSSDFDWQTTLNIGFSQDASPNYFNGTIDEVRVWSVARSQSEVQHDMTSSLAGNESGLLMYWRFNDGSGTSATDATVNGHSGTLTNGPVWVVSDAPFPAPIALLSQSNISFGYVDPPATKTDTVVVTNIGSETLEVSSVTSTNSEFSVSPTSASIEPSASQEFSITFAPIGNGYESGSIIFVHNASGSPDTVAVDGYGGTPPVIGVTPDSLSANLNVGDTTTQALIISNTGGSDLTYDISLEAVVVEKLSMKNKFGKISSKNIEGNVRKPVRTSINTRRNNNVKSPKPAALPKKPASAQPSILTVDFASSDGLEALTNLGYSYTTLTESEFATVNFSDYDVLFIASGSNTTPLYNRQADIATFVDGGGGLITMLAGDYGWLPVSVIANSCDGNGVQITDAAHLLLIGLNDVALSNWSDSYHETYSSYDGDLSALAVGTDCGDTPMLLAGQYGFGKIVVTGLDPDYHYLYGDHSTDAGTFITNAISWAGGGKWLRLSETSGTVPPDGSDTIVVTFDARNIFGGDYNLNVSINNNDPANPTVTIPAHLHVTGIPDITVSDTALDLGDVFVGNSKTDTLVLTNNGTDVLDVTSIYLGEPGRAKITGDLWYVSPSSAILNPNESVDVLVTFTPFDSVAYPEVLTIESNDPDMGSIEILLSGNGLYPPDIAVSPESLSDTLSTGQTTYDTLTIANEGLSDLTWGISVVDDVPIEVVMKSPRFTSSKKTNIIKEKKVNKGRPDASKIYTFPEQKVAPMFNKEKPRREVQSVTLDYVLNRLNLFYTNVTNAIPNVYNFDMDGDDGVNDYYIDDGGNDMYDEGNQLGTDLGYYLQYSDNSITGGGEILGPYGQYFTRKLPGLWVFAADMHGVDYFEITGGLGADGDGTTDGSVLEIEYQGTTYRGFVKRVNDGGEGDPSVNHLIIVPYGTGVSQEFSTDTDDDYHRVFNLSNTSRIYYLLFAGSQGQYYNDEVMMNVMNAFLSSLNLVETITPMPSSGVVERGTSVDVPLLIDGKSLGSGDYTKNIIVTSNDPDEPSVTTPVYLNITGEQDIAVSPTSLDFGDVFATGSKVDTVLIINDGPNGLYVSNISIGIPEDGKLLGDPIPIFSTNISSAEIDPYSHAEVLVTFSPHDPVEYNDVLYINSNDPDMEEITVPLNGNGIPPPDISVNPESFEVTLFTGDTVDQTLTISNLGLNDLTFNLSYEQGLDATTITAKQKIEPVKKNLNVKQKTHVARRHDRKEASLSTKLHKSITGGKSARRLTSEQPTILAVTFTGDGTAILDEAELNYTAVDETEFYSANFSDYDVLFIASYANTGPLSDRAEDIQNFVNNGGGLVVLDQDDWGWMPVSLNPSGGWCGDIVTIVAPDHPIMNGITSEGLSNFGCSIHTLFPEYDSRLEVLAVGTPGDVTIPKVGGGDMPLILAGDIGGGRVVLSGEDNEHRLGEGPDDEAIKIVANMVYWAGEERFIRFSPQADTVAPSQSVDVTVTFDAQGLSEGDYYYNLNINSNDPDESLVQIPVTLHVKECVVVTSLNDGNWSNPKTWDVGRVPQLADSVVITAEDTVTLDIDGTCSALNVEGRLQFSADSGRTLTVTGGQVNCPGNVDISGALAFANVENQRLILGGSLNKTGTLFNTSFGTYGSQLSFIGGGTRTMIFEDGYCNVQLNNPLLRLQLLSEFTTVGLMHLTSGYIELGDNSLKVQNFDNFGTTASYIVTNGSGKLTRILNVESKMKSISGDPMYFPVGAGIGSYTPVTFYPSYNESDEFGVRVADGISSIYDEEATVKKTFVISEDIPGGNDPFFVYFQWNGSDEGSNFTRASAVGLAYEEGGWAMYGTPSSVFGIDPYYMNVGNIEIGNDFGGTVSLAIGTSAALPIQLSAFTASVLEGVNVKLDWTTISEINNYGFYVERKLTSEETFMELPNSFVKGAGTTNEEQHYTWTDKSVAHGTYHYRLRQVDLNGDFAYSQPIEVVVSGVVSVWDDGLPLEFKLLQNFPNPFNPVTEIRYAIKDAGFVTLKIYNVLGQEVVTLVNEQKQPGRYSARFEANTLSSGLYMYRLTSGQNTVVRQMMLIK
jgi:hypothetical protein